ncbi:hypothetical protein E3P86_01312 [Wallemia ichthyophaga]|uniref:C2H2-type domain-containing protein n=1 Tax=Wallemia ichthyophaga TaxID=245174 RepID=A0A4T0J867_WALIC|nr:hypothetical protein E3P86_01312 [Wallemia ichthyophaga]
MSAEKYTDYRQPNDDLLWSPSTNASNNYSLSSMGVDSPPEYSSSLPPINILGRETTFNNSRSLPSSIPMNELSINPSHITVPPPLDFDLGLRLTDDNGVTITCPRYEQQEQNSLDEKELDDDDYADDFVEGNFDDDDDWGCAHAEHGTSAKRGQSAYSHPRAKSPTPMVDTDITKRSRGRRVPTQDNQRVFKCPDARCQKVFVRNEHLKRHIKSLHRDEKPFECLDAGCNKRFTRLDNSPWKTLDMRIPDQPTNGLFSQMQWDSGLYLCDMICDGRGPFHDLSNKRVLEFGAGTGLPSLLFALKGSPHVVCSDYDDHYLIDNLRRNVTANSVRNVDVVGHIWGQDVAPLIPDGRKFNLILCADTLWMSDQLENLLKSLTATIDKQDESSRVVIIAGFHTNRPHWQKNTA